MPRRAWLPIWRADRLRWEFRWRLPADQGARYGRATVSLTLPSVHALHADKLAVGLAQRFQSFFSMSSPPIVNLHTLAQSWLDETLRADERQRAEGHVDDEDMVEVVAGLRSDAMDALRTGLTHAPAHAEADNIVAARGLQLNTQQRRELNQLLTRALVEFFSQYIDRALGHWPLNNGKQTGRATAAPGPAMTLQQAPDTYHAEKVTIKAWRASSASLNKRTLDNILAVYGRATPVIELDRAAGARYAESVKDRLASGQ